MFGFKMFGFNKKEKEYKNKIEELENKLSKLNNAKDKVISENTCLEYRNRYLISENERLEDFVDEIEEALKKLKGEE